VKNAFIIPGAYGYPEENWFPWLKQELEKNGYSVIIPQFPTPQNQSLTTWREAFDKYKNKLTRDTILIGHSIGSTFILSLLENVSEPVHGVFLVSGFISDLNNKEFNRINGSFYNKSFNWEKINENKFYIFHGDNDPYVPMDKAEELANKLHSQVNIIKNGGHLNDQAGFKTFPKLLEEIKKITL
jgi:predicted alpha/beta hydrolase family esterase